MPQKSLPRDYSGNQQKYYLLKVSPSRTRERFKEEGKSCVISIRKQITTNGPSGQEVLVVGDNSNELAGMLSRGLIVAPLLGWLKGCQILVVVPLFVFYICLIKLRVDGSIPPPPTM